MLDRLRFVTIAAACMALTGCSIVPLAPRSPGTPTPSPWLTDPVEVLALDKLTLPPGVTNVTVKTKPLTGQLEGYSYAYTVSWNGTIDTTKQFLAQTDRTISTTSNCTDKALCEQLLYGMVIDQIPDGSLMVYDGFRPGHGYGSLGILVDGPDFTTVHVSLALVPS